MSVQRYDIAPLRATISDEGYLIDNPVVGRVGVQEYRRADGTIRRELRLPEDVFADDSLASFAGKPITDGHPSSAVTAANARALMVGTMTGPGVKSDESAVTAPVVIYDGAIIDKVLNGGKRELSLGYDVELDETPGVYDGCPYDAIQRKIRINHLAIVDRGRAGVARFNVDAAATFPITNHEDMKKLKLDTGIEYDVAPEVAAAFDALTAKADAAEADATAKVDALTAERDTLKAEVAKIEQIKADAIAEAKAEVAARAELVAKAAKFDGVEVKDEMTDREIREACIKSVRSDADLTDKSDEYVAAAFDMSAELAKSDSLAKQRAAAAPGAKRDDEDSAYKNYIKNLGKKESK